MIFRKNSETVFVTKHTGIVEGILSNNEPLISPFKVSEDSEYILNTARSWLQSYDKKGYSNHLDVECCFLFSVDYEAERTEFYYLINFEGRNHPDQSVIMVARRVENIEDYFDIFYFGLRNSDLTTTRAIERTYFNEAVNTFYFSETPIALSSFYEFTQHPDFAESVATYNLLNY
ncbi:hypothetical protein [Pseudomonas caricapapayae]|uniref:hypothetical protein n=1 Tax=Pseudomonas caricapapayae TaxID=46678 RepID=UPI000F00950D|nr:hypothetical protein [Pseudomonas caricapapayae]